MTGSDATQQEVGAYVEKLESRQLRPTFTIPVDMTRKDTMDSIRSAFVRRKELSGRWRCKGRWAELHVPYQERRIWSPYLSIRVDEEADACSLFGRFAPSPAVWTFFMFVYGAVAFLVIFGAIFGYVQWTSGTGAWGFWSVWTGVPILLSLHGMSWVGQRLGRYQMIRLKTELEDVLLDLGDRVR